MRKQKLVVAVSSRTLFNLDDSHAIFKTHGKEAFCRYQIEHEDEILAPGYGFSLVKKFLAINDTVALIIPLLKLFCCLRIVLIKV